MKGLSNLRVSGPFNEKVFLLEWLSHNDCGRCFWTSHDGFSLHPDKKSVQEYVKADKKICNARIKFYETLKGNEGYSYEDIEKKFPSLHFHHTEPRTNKPHQIFVNENIRDFIIKHGEGLFIRPHDRILYTFVRGQYGETYKTGNPIHYM